jgi:hypothetical protein
MKKGLVHANFDAEAPGNTEFSNRWQHMLSLSSVNALNAWFALSMRAKGHEHMPQELH